MRRIRDIGEFGLIELISGWIGEGQGPRVVLGTGDDGAVLRPAKGHDIVVSTDSLVEDVHFRWRTQSARFVGRRAVVANLSDLAAMGAAPMGCVAALCVPPDLELRLVKGVVQGMVQEARAHGCPLVGGNLTSARETSITITVLGSVARGRDLRRHRVRVGDRVYVTGCLGGAALAVARAERREVAIRSLPVPRLAAGRALARLAGVGGCIDVSDGLLADLAHLLEGSGLGAHIEVGQHDCRRHRHHRGPQRDRGRARQVTMPKCNIDGREIEVAPGTTVIRAALELGIEVPHFCWHPDLSVDGNCRMCLVEVEKMPKLQIACNTQVTDGMVVRTESEAAKRAHRTTLEFLLVNHPIDCPVCDQAGECYLQDHYMSYGRHDSKIDLEEKVRKRKLVDLGPIMLDAERCVLCSRCIRFEREVTGTNSFEFVNRGDHMQIATYGNRPITPGYAGNLADVS